jgi:iron-sulfur cluster assembly protein
VAETTTAEATVHVTPKAVGKIKESFAREGVSGGGLRLGVLGGGCSGLSYQFKYDKEPRPNDHIFEFNGVKVFVDPKSMLYLNGMTLDYKESLMYSGFAFENPNAEKSCGCGTSFTA